MTNKWSTHKIINILRVISFGFTILFLITLSMWSFMEKNIGELDKTIVNYYVDPYQDALRDSKLLIDVDKEQGIDMLEDLLNDLNSTKKSDRLAPIKRKSFMLVTRVLWNLGQFDRALGWVEQWLIFDPKDLYAKVESGRLLRKTPEQKDEGTKLIEALYEKVPKSEIVATTYAEMQLESGNFLEAFLAMSKYIDLAKHSLLRKWYIFWDTGEGFNDKNMMPSPLNKTSDGGFSLELELPPNIQRLRFDPPPFSRLLITRPTLKIHGGCDKQLSLWEVQPAFHHMSRDNDEFVTSGGNDPFFHFDMPDDCGSDASMKVFLTARIEPRLPEIMFRIVTAVENVDAVRQKMLSSGEIAASKRFEKLLSSLDEEPKNEGGLYLSKRKQSLLGCSFDFYWKNGEDHFSETNKTSRIIELEEIQGELRFDLSFAVGAEVSQLRFDFPDGNNFSYVLEVVEVDVGGTKSRIDVNHIDLLLNHNIEQSDNLFKVIGRDPHFSFQLPQGVRYVEHVHVKGLVE